MPGTKFVHLHSHSHYSLLDGLGKIPDIVARAKELKMDSIALTDHGVLYGAIEFYQEATKQGIKPIVGVEAYVAPGSRLSKTTDDTNPYHLILLAENKIGYQNLLKLVTAAHLEGYYYKPRIDWELLQEHHEGIVATSACLQGEVAQMVRRGDEAAAKATVERYAALFDGRYYLELQPHPNIPEQGTHNAAIRRLAKETGLPTVATNDSHYVLPDDAEPQDVLLCIQTGKLIEDANRMNMTGDDFSLKTGEQMLRELPEDADAIANTARIAERCNLMLEFGKIILPKFEVPSDQTPQQYLRELVKQGTERRYGSDRRQEVDERVEYELSVIEKMKYESYFLIVADLVNWSKDQGIAVGPGRGSAAGSIIAYVLNITNLDPLVHGLQFERFLNPDRISMPDIDMDFADDRRGEVIDYIAKKYGSDRVAQIITFGTMAARAAVRDTGRVLNLTYGEVDRVAKLIPFGEKLEAARKQPELRELAEQNPPVKRLLELATRLEGVARHASTHAAGVVIGDQPLVNYVPLQKATRGEDDAVVTQYSMWPIEAIGLLKVDILGLSNLTILRNAVEIIEAVDGVKIDVDALPLDDRQTFELLSRGQTHGVFQLESEGMRRYIKELKPSKFEDIVAMVALYRPGPMQWIDSFIRRKHGREQVSYIHPKVEAVLKDTYGTIVYQEQVMEISKSLSGFTGGEADTLRKAMGKKIASLMAQMKEKFIEGAVKNGVERALATKLFGELEDFSRYGFNKAHAAPYALIAYQTAYLKAHHPSAFMAALMTSEQENLDKLAQAISECEQMEIEVLPPDVNESFANFAVAPDKRAIRFGLTAIKNVGRHTVEAIVAARKADGPFAGLEDFLGRVADSIERKSLESLIKAGALDTFADRGRMLAGLEAMTRFAQTRAAEAKSGQTSLFGDGPTGQSHFALPAVSADAADSRQRLEWERELLGMYVSEHPLDSLASVVSRFPGINSLAQASEGRPAEFACLVTTAKRINTRKGEPMAFVTVEDRTGSTEVIVFPRLYLQRRDLLNPGAVLKVTGKISRKDAELKVLADTLETLTDNATPNRPPPGPSGPEAIEIEEIESVVTDGGPIAPPADVAASAQTTVAAPGQTEPADREEMEEAMSYDSLTVRLGPNTTLATLEAIKEVLTRHRGESEVYLVIQKSNDEKTLKLAHGIRYSKALIDELESVDWNVAVEAK